MVDSAICRCMAHKCMSFTVAQRMKLRVVRLRKPWAITSRRQRLAKDEDRWTPHSRGLQPTFAFEAPEAHGRDNLAVGETSLIDRDQRINLASSAQTGANRPSGRARGGIGNQKLPAHQ